MLLFKMPTKKDFELNKCAIDAGNIVNLKEKRQILFKIEILVSKYLF